MANLFVNNDTQEQISNYLDKICEKPEFLCENKDLCGTSTSIHKSIETVNKICKGLETDKCENNIKECVISAKNLLNESGPISTSFVNIILPIPNEVDDAGNQRFLRLPALSPSKNKNSKDICDICECMNRFSTGPGSSSNTSPGQNQCIYPETFEYFYYPVSIENINNVLSNTPPLKLGKYTVINSNIIYASSEEALEVGNLFDLLIKNGISLTNSVNFVNTLYQNNKVKELNLYILNKNKKLISQENKKNFYENITLYCVVFIIFIITIIFFLKVIV